MERDSLDKAACAFILETFASKPLFWQKLFQGYVLDEYGRLIVESKEEAIKILDSPDSSFEQKITATIFAEGYKEICEVANMHVLSPNRAEIPNLRSYISHH